MDIPNWAQAFFWEALALFVMPFLGFRVTQWLKQTYRRLTNTKCHWLILQAVTFAVTCGGAFYCLQHKYEQSVSLWCAFIVACFAGVIIEWVIKRSKTAAPALHAALTEEQDDRTVMGTILGAGVKK